MFDDSSSSITSAMMLRFGAPSPPYWHLLACFTLIEGVSRGRGSAKELEGSHFPVINVHKSAGSSLARASRMSKHALEPPSP